MNYCNCGKLGKLIKILYALEMFSYVFGSLFSLFSGVSFSWNYALTANAIAYQISNKLDLPQVDQSNFTFTAESERSELFDPSSRLSEATKWRGQIKYRTKDIFEGLVIHHSLVLFVHRIFDMTPALFSVYRPYIMFFALIDKFHQLLKVSESCFSYMC